MPGQSAFGIPVTWLPCLHTKHLPDTPLSCSKTGLRCPSTNSANFCFRIRFPFKISVPVLSRAAASLYSERFLLFADYIPSVLLDVYGCSAMPVIMFLNTISRRRVALNVRHRFPTCFSPSTVFIVWTLRGILSPSISRNFQQCFRWNLAMPSMGHGPPMCFSRGCVNLHLRFRLSAGVCVSYNYSYYYSYYYNFFCSLVLYSQGHGKLSKVVESLDSEIIIISISIIVILRTKRYCSTINYALLNFQ